MSELNFGNFGEKLLVSSRPCQAQTADDFLAWLAFQKVASYFKVGLFIFLCEIISPAIGESAIC